MINAAEAKELVKSSDLMVNRFLAAIDLPLRAAAEAGKTSLVCSAIITGLPSHDVLSVHAPTSKTPELTKLQMRIVDELKKLGFGAQFEKHGDPYVPRGLQSDYDDAQGPQYQHWALIVRW